MNIKLGGKYITRNNHLVKLNSFSRTNIYGGYVTEGITEIWSSWKSDGSNNDKKEWDIISKFVRNKNLEKISNNELILELRCRGYIVVKQATRINDILK